MLGISENKQPKDNVCKSENVLLRPSKVALDFSITSSIHKKVEGMRFVLKLFKVVLLSATVLGTLYFCENLNELHAQINGVLRVHPTNPKYFTDNSGKAIYLGGHQIFIDLQDNTFNKEFTYNFQTTLDFPWYMQFVYERNLNYIRNWTEMSTGGAYGVNATPMPYMRVSGHGDANDGLPKFDLNQFNQAFFDRMRSRVIDAGNRGIYVSIMLYDVYAFSNFPPPLDPMWAGNVFNADNNINGINADSNGDGWGTEFFTSPSSQIRFYQQSYIKKVIDTVNDLDNVFYEISNEAAGLEWHKEMINFVRSYELSKPKQHLVFYSPGGLSGRNSYDFPSYDDVIALNSDVFAASLAFGHHYRTNPPINISGKPGIFDVDHIASGVDAETSNIANPWAAFTRGYHFNLYDTPFERPESESHTWEIVRKNVGEIVHFANKKFFDLAKTNPQTGLSSTGFALANPGCEYLIFQPANGSFTVNLRPGTYGYEWFNPNTAQFSETGSVTVNSLGRTFIPPFDGLAVLHLKPAGTSTVSPAWPETADHVYLAEGESATSERPEIEDDLSVLTIKPEVMPRDHLHEANCGLDA